MMPNEFQWSAFNPNRWDHYYHAGLQVRENVGALAHCGLAAFNAPLVADSICDCRHDGMPLRHAETVVCGVCSFRAASA